MPHHCAINIGTNFQRLMRGQCLIRCMTVEHLTFHRAQIFVWSAAEIPLRRMGCYTTLYPLALDDGPRSPCGVCVLKGLKLRWLAACKHHADTRGCFCLCAHVAANDVTRHRGEHEFAKT